MSTVSKTSKLESLKNRRLVMWRVWAILRNDNEAREGVFSH